MMIQILICDDQVIVCEGLQTILDSDTEIEVVAVAHDGAEALQQIPETHPDLILMDLKMPHMNGIVATRKIKALHPQVLVLVLTTYDDDEWLFDAIRSGASGYLLKDTPPQELISAIKGTVAGQTFVDPGVAGKVLDAIAQQPDTRHANTKYNLSEREQEVLGLIAQGLSNADIAERLYLTEGTIRNYTSALFRKLGVSDRTQAAVVALRYGLVNLSNDQ